MIWVSVSLILVSLFTIDVFIFTMLAWKSAKFTAVSIFFKSLLVSNKSPQIMLVSLPISLMISNNSDLNCLKSNFSVEVCLMAEENEEVSP